MGQARLGSVTGAFARTLGVVLPWAGALLGPTASSAQAPPPDTLTVSIEPLRVTVLRAPSGSAPFAVATVTERALREGKTGAFLEEAFRGLPGVQVQNRFNFAVGERVSIRGFGSRAQFGVRGVKILVDGIPATFADGQSALDHVDLGSLGRVEVLRGPGSALYGNGAGGVLTLETASPPELPRQELRLTGGDDGLLNVQARSSGTSGGVGYVVSLNRLDYDGFRTDPSTPGEVYGAADRWLVNATARHRLGGGVLSFTLNGLDLEAENPGSLSEETLATEGPVARGFNVSQRTGKTVRQGQLGSRWRGGLGAVEGDFALWGIVRDVDNPIPPSVIALDRVAGGLRALLRGDRGELAWGGGAELELQRDDRLNFENDGGERGPRTLDQEDRVVALGLFANARHRRGRLSLIGALRYDRFHFRTRDRFLVAGDPDDSGSRTMDAFSPSLGAFVDARDEIGIFANVAYSLETPTTTELINRPGGAGGFNPDLDPQRGITVELGIRGRASRVSYELTSFRSSFDDELVPFEVSEQPGRVFFRNAGSSTRTGVEAALRLGLDDVTELALTYSHVNAEFEEFVVDGVDHSGNDVPGVSPNRFEARLKRGGERWFADVDFEWVDEVPVDDAGLASAPDHALVGVRAGLRGLRVAGLSVSPFTGVSNVFDEDYVSSVVVNAFGGRFFEPGPGRAFHAGLALGWPAR